MIEKNGLLYDATQTNARDGVGHNDVDRIQQEHTLRSETQVSNNITTREKKGKRDDGDAGKLSQGRPLPSINRIKGVM